MWVILGTYSFLLNIEWKNYTLLCFTPPLRDSCFLHHSLSLSLYPILFFLSRLHFISSFKMFLRVKNTYELLYPYLLVVNPLSFSSLFTISFLLYLFTRIPFSHFHRLNHVLSCVNSVNPHCSDILLPPPLSFIIQLTLVL